MQNQSTAADRRHAALRLSKGEPAMDWHTQEDKDRNYTRVLQQYMIPLKFSNKLFKKWALAYLKKYDVATYRQVREGRESLFRFGAVLRMLMRPNGLRMEWMTAKEKEFLQKHIQNAVSRCTSDEDENRNSESTPRKTLSAQQIMMNQRNSLIEIFDGYIDRFPENPDKTPLGILKEKGISAKASRLVALYYESQLEEIEMASKLTARMNPNYTDKGVANDSNSVQIREGYNGYSRKELKALASYIREIVEACQQEVQSSSKTRKPRVKKLIKVSDLAKKVNYLTKFPELNLESVSPTKLFSSNATEIWLYNTKYKKIARYISDGNPFIVKGTTIKGFDVKKSVEMRLRKPDEFFKGLSKMTKRPLVNACKSVKTKSYTPTGRINGDCIILAVI